MTKRRWKYLAVFTGLALFLAALLVPQFQVLQRPRDVEIVQSLRDPLVVVDWDESGLFLADGSPLGLPGVSQLPLSSQLLNQATAAGVEVTSDGRVIGLMHIHRWCGNDPVRLHIARVDLSHLLMFLHEAELPTKYAELAEMRDDQVGISFSEYGWNVSKFFRFQSWSKLATWEDDETGEPRARARGYER